MFTQLKKDADIAAGVPLRKVVYREVRECVSNIVKAFQFGIGISKFTLTYLMIRYFLSKVIGYQLLHSADKVTINLRVHQNKVKVILRKNQSDLFTLCEVFLNGLYDFPFKKVRSPINTIVDLGANAGIATAYLSSLFPEARIICVEPIDENVNVILSNSDISGGRWHIEQAAISGEDKPLTFFASEWWSSGTLIDNIVNQRRAQTHRLENRMSLPKREVLGVTIQSLMKKLDISSIDILKIDIEGAEEQVVETAGEWIDKVAIIIIEIHDKYIEGDRVRQCFHEYGFTPMAHSGDCEVFVRQQV